MHNIDSDRIKSFRDLVLEKEKQGMVVLNTPMGFYECEIDSFIDQPVDLLLDALLKTLEDNIAKNDLEPMQRK